jgi:Protein of unknown function (DUF3489)
MVTAKRNHRPKVISGKSQPKSRPTLKPTAHKQRANSKQEKVLDLLRRSEGASIAVISKATGWQAHSVRGFFAGVVRKKLRLTLESAKTEGVRIYRIVGTTSSKPKGNVPTAESAAA